MGVDTADYLDSVDNPEALIQTASNLTELKEAIISIEEKNGEILGREGKPLSVGKMIEVLDFSISMDDEKFVKSYFLSASPHVRGTLTHNHGIRAKYMELLKKRYVEIAGVEPIA